LNFPLLYFASLLLEQYARANEIGEIFFVSRDCLLWHKLYRQMFPGLRATYLYTSRKCLFQPSASYLEYFRSTWHPRGVIVDLTSTGISWSRFFAGLVPAHGGGEPRRSPGGTPRRSRRFFCIGRIDDYAYVRNPIAPDEWLDITAVFRTSELKPPANKAVEMLNYAAHGCVEDVLLPGNAPLPVLADKLEYDPALPGAVDEAFTACMERIGRYPELAESSRDSLTELIKAIVGFICADPHISAIYAGHQVLDEAYVRRLL